MKFTKIMVAALCLGAAFGAAGCAGKGTSATAVAKAPETRYTIDPSHSSIYFEITHLGLSQTHGRFNECSGTIMDGGGDPTKGRIEFALKTASLDTAVPPRDEHLRSADFFDVAKYPEATFNSSSVRKSGKGYIVTGDFTLKGVTKQIEIPFRYAGPLSLKEFGDQPPQIGIIAEPIVIKRSDYGIGEQITLSDGTAGASDDVIVHISLEASAMK